MLIGLLRTLSIFSKFLISWMQIWTKYVQLIKNFCPSRSGMWWRFFFSYLKLCENHGAEEDVALWYQCTPAGCVPHPRCVPHPPPSSPVTRIWTNIERNLNSIYLYNGWNSTNLFRVLISVYITWYTRHSLQITKRVILYFLSWYAVDRIHYIWCYIYHCFHSNVSFL